MIFHFFVTIDNGLSTTIKRINDTKIVTTKKGIHSQKYIELNEWSGDIKYDITKNRNFKVKPCIK